MIWNQEISLESLNKRPVKTMSDHLGIEFYEIGPNYLRAKMPVNERTQQPYGLLHGGASASLAETMGSVAAYYMLEDWSKQAVVGVELNCSHVRGAKEGYVIGTVKPLKIGRRLQVWNIEIKNEQEQLICVSRLTLMVVSK